MRSSVCLVLLVLGCSPAASAGAGQPLDVAPFTTIELHDGGHVRVRRGERRQVTLVQGEPRQFCASVEGERLRVGKCPGSGRRERRVEVEITTPDLDAVSVHDGGMIVVADGFPRRAAFAAAVANGGSIDIRRLAADRVSASVASGGSIYASAAQRLDASVTQGGVIVYWGDAEVRSATRRGGMIRRGTEAEWQRPADAMMPPLPEPHSLRPLQYGNSK